MLLVSRYSQFVVPKKFEKNEKIPYKEVVHLLQYVYNKETNELVKDKLLFFRFEWTFINSLAKEEGLPKNEDYSSWDIKSVLTNTTGFSYSSVRSSALNKKIIKLKSVSQMSRYGDEGKQSTQNNDMKQTIYREPSLKLIESMI